MITFFTYIAVFAVGAYLGFLVGEQAPASHSQLLDTYRRGYRAGEAETRARYLGGEYCQAAETVKHIDMRV